jgi:hypothetical protein
VVILRATMFNTQTFYVHSFRSLSCYRSIPSSLWVSHILLLPQRPLTSCLRLLPCFPVAYIPPSISFNYYYFTGFTTHLRVLASSFLRFRDHTQIHTSVSRTPLDEWSARRRDLYLTNTQHSQQTKIYALGGIRTRNPSRRAAADPRLRPLALSPSVVF